MAEKWYNKNIFNTGGIRFYFCPKCGKTLEGKDAIHEKLSRFPSLQHALCPIDRTRLQVSGGALIVLGLLGILFSGLVDPPELLAACSTAILILGIMRLWRQYRAEKIFLREIKEGKHVPGSTIKSDQP